MLVLGSFLSERTAGRLRVIGFSFEKRRLGGISSVSIATDMEE